HSLPPLAYFLGCGCAFLLDRGASLFDNRYDVPESVRNHWSFSSANGLSKFERSTIRLAGCLGCKSRDFFRQATRFKREFDHGSERKLAVCLTHKSRVSIHYNMSDARRTG